MGSNLTADVQKDKTVDFVLEAEVAKNYWVKTKLTSQSTLMEWDFVVEAIIKVKQIMVTGK